MRALVLFLVSILFVQLVTPKSINFTPDLKFSWTISEADKTITCEVTWTGITGAGWVSVGWHALGDPDNSMTVTDMIITIFNEEGKGTVQDHLSTQFSTPPNDVQMGGTNDILSFNIEKTATSIISTFTRKLDTGDAFDFPLQPGPSKLIYAFGEGEFSYHGPKAGVAVADFFDDSCGNYRTCETCLSSSSCVMCTIDELCYNKDNIGQCSMVNTTCENPITQQQKRTTSQQTCPSSLTPLPNAWVPAGFCASVWATGVTGPRGIVAAQNGDILVVERVGSRITVLWDDNNDGHSDSSERAVIAAASGLTHSIEINGGYLYASSSTTLFRWKYEPGTRTSLGSPEVVVTNIPCCHHNTRTIAFDKDGLLYLSVGSGSNVDPDSTHARINRFDIYSAPSLPVAWSTGFVFADGLRNEVGISFDRDDVLWGVENGVDNLYRDDLGGDIHNNNPAEEVNKFSTPGKFYGYPYCWSEYSLPNGIGKGPGTQWVQPDFEGVPPYSDAWCQTLDNVVPPVWSMAAHQAPLDIKFYYGNSFPSQYVGGAFVSLHGSWNRNPPQGYRVNYLTVQNGIPVREDVVLRHAGSAENWPNGIRPVGITNSACRDSSGDTKDCLFITSDASGHIIKLGYYN